MTVLRNVAYADRDPRQRLDLYLPAHATAGGHDAGAAADRGAPTRFTTLMLVSGGGWTSGSRTWIAGLGEHFAALGYGVALVDHRLVPNVTQREQATDLAAAFAWTRRSIGDHGGDPTRIVVGGHSAGGHLTSLMLCDPRYLAEHGLGSADISGFIGVSAAYDPSASRGVPHDLCPTAHVRATLPRHLLIDAQHDLDVVPAMTAAMRDLLTAAHVDVVMARIPGADHFSVIEHPETLRLIHGWLAAADEG